MHLKLKHYVFKKCLNCPYCIESNKACRQREGRASIVESNDTSGTMEAEHQRVGESAMGAHTLEVIPINSTPLSTTNLKGP